ncbi:MAG TPA: cupin domain-containing protein [Thermoanaerobaculia bacterium]|nr:cupin domain-containing protein [Thermoanaerobaculia bacterium]
MRTALDLLLSPIGEEEFFRDHWERRHLHVKRHVQRDDPERFATLFSASDLPQVLAAAVQAMRHQPPYEVPCIEIIARAEDPRPVAESPTVARVCAAVDSGATVRLNQLHRYWPPLRSFVLQLQNELGFIPGLSVYCSPPDGPGLGAHFDGHDNFVVQIAGSKRWRVGPGPELPLEIVPLLPFETRDEMLRHRVPAPAFTHPGALEEILLAPGDVLYVPRGTIHDVQAIGTPTVHLSFGIQQITWVDYITTLAASAGLRDPRLRRGIPVRHHRTPPAAMQAAAEEALAALAESASAPEAFRVIAAQFDRASAGSAFSWDEAVAGLTPETPMELAPAVSLAYEESDDDVALVAGPTRVLGPPSYGEAFRFIASSRALAAHDIPGELPPGEQLSIARRLVRERLYLTPREVAVSGGTSAASV